MKRRWKFYDPYMVHDTDFHTAIFSPLVPRKHRVHDQEPHSRSYQEVIEDALSEHRDFIVLVALQQAFYEAKGNGFKHASRIREMRPQ